MQQSEIDVMKHYYIEYRTRRYMLEHPDTRPSKARQYARNRWRQRVQRWQQKGIIPA